MNSENRIIGFKLKHVLIFLASIAAAMAAIYALGSFSHDPEFLYGMLAIAFVPPAGKESVIPALVYRGIETPIIFSTIVFADLAACFIILSSFEVVEYIAGKLEFLHNALEKAGRRAESAKRHGLLHIGLTAFMFIPFQGTGSIVTSFLAQVLGVKNWKTILIVLIGSVLSTLFFLSVSLGIIEFL